MDVVVGPDAQDRVSVGSAAPGFIFSGITTDGLAKNRLARRHFEAEVEAVPPIILPESPGLGMAI